MACDVTRSTLVTVLARAAILGSMRGAMVGLTVGMRGWTLRLGVTRIIACAEACGMSIKANGAASAISAIAAQPALIRRLMRSALIGPRLGPQHLRSGRSAALRRGLGEADDLLAAQLAHQAGHLVLAHRLAAELQAEQAVGAAEHGGL